MTNIRQRFDLQLSLGGMIHPFFLAVRYIRATGPLHIFISVALYLRFSYFAAEIANNKLMERERHRQCSSDTKDGLTDDDAVFSWYCARFHNDEGARATISRMGFRPIHIHHTVTRSIVGTTLDYLIFDTSDTKRKYLPLVKW